MAHFQRKPDPVEAVKFDAGTGSLTVGELAVDAGEWLIKHADGSFSKMAAEAFQDLYEQVEDAAPASSEAPTEPPADPAAQPETV
jgi:hypothetical protein